jgi:gas vesicle protein
LVEFDQNQEFPNQRRETMRRKSHKNQNKRDVGKVITGMLLGSVFGATVGLLMAPTSGEETRRKIKDEAMGVREKVKTAAGNVESRARELAEDVSDKVKGSATQRRKITYTES